MRVKQLVEFSRIDFLPSAENHIFLAVYYCEEPFLVHSYDVPSEKPPILNCCLRLFREVDVPFHHLRPLNAKLAGLTGSGNLYCVVIHVHNFRVGVRDGKTYCPRLRLSAEWIDMADRRAFSQSVAFTYLGSGCFSNERIVSNGSGDAPEKHPLRDLRSYFFKLGSFIMPV